jgi:hypothetical protein
MPDWTYIPLRKFTSRVLGTRRSQRNALRLVSRIARVPGGRSLIRGFSFSIDHPETQVVIDGTTYASSIGVELSKFNQGTEAALQAMGFGFVCTTATRPPGTVRTHTTDLEEIAKLTSDGAQLVVANEAVIEHGPDTAQRINESLVSRTNTEAASPLWFGFRFWHWPGWVWALWLGIAMICAGIGATLITLGPVVLNYDVTFLGTNLQGLDAIDPKLVKFLQHDRITMAGCMMAIGCNDIGFALAMRRGWRWAKVGFALAGGCGFPTFFLFLGYQFIDPLHLAVAVGFFPLYLLALIRPSVAPAWTAKLRVNETSRRRALVGQLLLVSVAFGVAVSGIVIMFVGLNNVFIPSDLAYLGNDQRFFSSQLNGRLLRFVAHDRAGFGGALFSLGIGILTIVLWGWRDGDRSTWWSTFMASLLGFGPALAIHFSVDYTDTLHLLPAYLGALLVWLALLLSREWMLTK